MSLSLLTLAETCTLLNPFLELSGHRRVKVFFYKVRGFEKFFVDNAWYHAIMDVAMSFLFEVFIRSCVFYKATLGPVRSF